MPASALVNNAAAPFLTFMHVGLTEWQLYLLCFEQKSVQRFICVSLSRCSVGQILDKSRNHLASKIVCLFLFNII